jgi:hypothetical protein
MKNGYNIEDIEALRVREGIDDIELRDIVGHLVAGDCVRLTFLDNERPSHTLMVRITRAEGRSFRGRLIQCPSKGIPDGLRLGVMLDFRSNHIHSVVRAVARKKGS